MRPATLFAEGVGTGVGLVVVLMTLMAIVARGSRMRTRIRRTLDEGPLRDPAPPSNYLELCRAAGL